MGGELSPVSSIRYHDRALWPAAKYLLVLCWFACLKTTLLQRKFCQVRLRIRNCLDPCPMIYVLYDFKSCELPVALSRIQSYHPLNESDHSLKFIREISGTMLIIEIQVIGIASLRGPTQSPPSHTPRAPQTPFPTSTFTNNITNDKNHSTLPHHKGIIGQPYSKGALWTIH